MRALTLLVDTGAQTVLNVHVTTTRKPQTQIGPQITKRNLECLRTLVADKGYDDRAHRHRLKAWGKAPPDKHRELVPKGGHNAPRMDERLYHQRSLAEIVSLVLKCKYGAVVGSRVWWRQFREFFTMCLVYNVERVVKLGVTFLDRLLSQMLYFLHQGTFTEPL